MKKILLYLSITIAAGGFVSCSKTKDIPLPSSSLTIVNVVAGGADLYAQFYYGTVANSFMNAPIIGLNGFKEFGGYSGDVPLSFFNKADTVNVFYSDSVHLDMNNIYTLFLTGTSSAPEAFFYKEAVLPRYAASDSVMGIRFANLSSGSSAVRINIQGSSDNEAQHLAYKGVSDFKAYSVAKTIQPGGSYIFELRDDASGALITTYILGSAAAMQSKNVTILLRGVPNGTGTSAQSAVLANDF